MPLYEYQCVKCSHQAEKLEKIDSPRVQKCPHCGENTFTKKVSAPQFKLKGTGWYETDFKTPKHNAQKKTQDSSDAVEKKPSSDSSTTKNKTDKKSDA